MADYASLDEFAANSQAFLAWLHQNGAIVSSKIILADLREQGAGRGVVAQQDIDEDEELFHIPRSLILTAENSSLPDDVKKRTDDPWLSSIVSMIYEHSREDQSQWKAYFDVLPLQFDTLMFWSDAELKHLEASAVVNKIGKQSADNAFKQQVVPLLKEHANVFKIDGTNDDEKLLDICHRMGSTIMAYAFDLEKPDSATSKDGEDGWEEDDEETEILPKGMVPLADILNADADRNNAKLFYEEDKVVMKAVKPIKAGDEIFNDYGPLPTADVLRRYGYTTANYAKYDVVEISLDLISAAVKDQLKLQEGDLHDRMAYLDDQGVLDDGYDITRTSHEDGQFPDDLCILLNTIALPKPDFDKLKKKEKLPKPTLSPEALQLLYAILVRRRAMYETHPPSFYDDAISALSGDTSQSARRRVMAYQVVKGEKEVLREASATVQDMRHPGKKRGAETLESDAATWRKKQKSV